jgi:PHP family Zn ribbon phosphoesterase
MGHRSFEIATAEGRVWRCPACGDDREFVQPPCVDGHTADGGACPEWACADCGAAVTSGSVAVVAAVSVARRAA